MAILPGKRLGPHKVPSAIGAGGMGKMSRARDTRVDRSGTVMMLGRAFLEARATRMPNPNCVSSDDLVDSDDHRE